MVDAAMLRAALMLLHALAGAAWFGSIFYGVFVLYPRVRRHFNDIAEGERLLMALSHGARWNMIAAMTLVASSGLGLLLLPRGEMSWPWLALPSRRRFFQTCILNARLAVSREVPRETAERASVTPLLDQRCRLAV